MKASYIRRSLGTLIAASVLVAPLAFAASGTLRVPVSAQAAGTPAPSPPANAVGFVFDALDFPSVLQGSAQTLAAIIWNGGTAPVALGAATISGVGFSLEGTSCGPSLGSGLSCDYQVRFSPQSTAPEAGSLEVVTGDGVRSLPLTGTPLVMASLELEEAFIDGGELPYPAQTDLSMVVRNTSSVAATGLGFQLTSIAGQPVPEYSVHSTTCGPTLAPQSSCSATFRHRATDAGMLYAMVTVSATNAPSVQGALAVSTTLAPPVLAQTSEWGPLYVGSSARATFTLTNNSEARHRLTNPPISLFGNANFGEVVGTTCGDELASGASCTAEVEVQGEGEYLFEGFVRANLLTGIGPSLGYQVQAVLPPAPLAISPFELSFDSGTSTRLTVYVQNTGVGPLQLGYTSLSLNTFQIFSNTCTRANLSPGATCEMGIRYTGSVPRPVTAFLTIPVEGYPAATLPLLAP